MIQKYRNFKPQIDQTCYIAPGSVIIGDVIIGMNSSVWFQAVIRGDIAKITIGENTNIQDGCIIHCKTGIEVNIGNNVTIGHGAIIHSCTIGDGCLIGMGSIILDGAKIGRNCLIAAGSVVSNKIIIEDGSFVVGNPAFVKRKMTEKVILQFQKSAARYVELAREYRTIYHSFRENNPFS